LSSERFHSSWTVNLLQEKRLFLTKKKISIEIMFYVCCMQCMQHIFDRFYKSCNAWWFYKNASWKLKYTMTLQKILRKLKHMMTFTSYKSWNAKWLYKWLKIKNEFWYDYNLQRRCIFLETHSKTLLIWWWFIRENFNFFKRLFHQNIIWYLQEKAQIVWFIQEFKQLMNFTVYEYYHKKEDTSEDHIDHKYMIANI